MTVEAMLYYWIECDHPGCDARSPSRGYEISAWDSKEAAQNCALNEDWRQVRGTTWVCFDHAVEYCNFCGEHISPRAGEQDYLCGECELESA